MTDRNIARIRTALPQAWAALIVYLVHRFGVVLDDTSTNLLLVIIPIVGAINFNAIEFV